METYRQITPPTSETDTTGARRVFEDFFDIYQPTLRRIERHLEGVIDEAGPHFAEAYRHWYKALRDVFRGVYFVSKNLPLPNKDAFLEALRMFSFDSAIQFLKDICVDCRIALERDWAQHFHQHIDTLLFSYAVLTRQQKQTSVTR